MKQNLISFLGEVWVSRLERITDSNLTHRPAVAVYPACNFFPQGLLMSLIEFANNNGYLYYIDVIDGNLRMRIYEDV